MPPTWWPAAFPATSPVGTWQIVREIGIPVLVADVVQFVVNLVLLAVVVRLAAGMPMRAQVGRLLGSSGPAHLGYGIIAFIMVVLWGPAGLGSASVFLILPPLVVAQWAYRQYAEEVKGHERALHVLVAAVEAKAPAPHGPQHPGGRPEREHGRAARSAQPGGRGCPGRRDAARPRAHDPAHRAGPQHRRRRAAGSRATRPSGSGCCRGSASCPGRSTPSRTTARPSVARAASRPERRRPRRRARGRVRPAHRGGHALTASCCRRRRRWTCSGARRPVVRTSCARSTRPCHVGRGCPREVGAARAAPARVRGPSSASGVLVLALGLYAGGGTLLDQLAVHRLTVAVFVIAITVGELFRLRMPSGREAAPLASASALAFVFLAEVYGQPILDVDADFVVVVVATGLLLAAVVRAAEGRAVGLDQVAARLVGVATAAWLARAFAPNGQHAVGARGRPGGLAVARRDRHGGRRRGRHLGRAGAVVGGPLRAPAQAVARRAARRVRRGGTAHRRRRRRRAPWSPSWRPCWACSPFRSPSSRSPSPTSPSGATRRTG